MNKINKIKFLRKLKIFDLKFFDLCECKSIYLYIYSLTKSLIIDSKSLGLNKIF